MIRNCFIAEIRPSESSEEKNARVITVEVESTEEAELLKDSMAKGITLIDCSYVIEEVVSEELVVVSFIIYCDNKEKCKLVEKLFGKECK